MTEDEIPERLRDMVEGEMRATLQCNICGALDQISIIVPERLRSKLAEIIKQDPEDVLEATREMACICAGWTQVGLRDGGGLIDICPECVKTGRWQAL